MVPSNVREYGHVQILQTPKLKPVLTWDSSLEIMVCFVLQ